MLVHAVVVLLLEVVLFAQVGLEANVALGSVGRVGEVPLPHMHIRQVLCMCSNSPSWRRAHLCTQILQQPVR